MTDQRLWNWWLIDERHLPRRSLMLAVRINLILEAVHCLRARLTKLEEELITLRGDHEAETKGQTEAPSAQLDLFTDKG